MTPDPFSLSRLLRSWGTAPAIVAAFNRDRPPHVRLLSTPTVESWMRKEGSTRAPGRPRWDVVPHLASSLSLPVDVVLRACAGLSDA